jgi:ubiquinone/menaquinone biosynthesis C-methylase UbiE
VILVGVHVEESSVRGESSADRVERPAVTALGEVRDGFENVHVRTLGIVKAYYDARAAEYDEWYLGLGRFDGLDRGNWDDDVRELERAVAALPPSRTLDVACGTGFLTRHLRGDVTALDQSPRMLEIVAERVPEATLVQSDALELPFADAAFERVFTGHFYGHLEEDDRTRFLAEAQRVAGELVVVDTIRRQDRGPVQWEERVLNDGSRWHVYKRYFTPEQLCEELGGGEVLLANRWFVMVRTGAQLSF